MDLDAHLCDINWTIYSLASSKYKTTFWDQCLLLPCDICIGLVHIGCDPPWLPPSLSLLTWLSQSKSKNCEQTVSLLLVSSNQHFFVLNCQIYNIIFLYCLSKIGFSCMTKMLGAGSNTCITDTYMICIWTVSKIIQKFLWLVLK